MNIFYNQIFVHAAHNIKKIYDVSNAATCPLDGKRFVLEMARIVTLNT